MSYGRVFDVQRFCLHDGPGIRTMVFLKGCPLSCKWCCNPESQSPQPEIMFFSDKCIGCRMCETVCPHNALSFKKGYLELDRSKCMACGKCSQECPSLALRLSGKTYRVEELIEELLEDIIYFEQSGGGVTVSGGEPLSQPDFVLDLLKCLKRHNVHTVIETSGYVKWEVFQKVIDYTDLILLDIKHLDIQSHIDATGCGNELILQNFELLCRYAKQLIIRSPLIPDFNMEPEYVQSLTRYVQQHGISNVEFLPYHRMGEQKYSALNREYRMKK